MRTLVIIFGVILSLSSTIFAQTAARDNHFELGIGLVGSSDYKDALQSSFSDISGWLGWIRMDLGYAVNITENLQLIPKGGLLVSFIEIRFGNFPSSKKANYIFLPGLSARYYFGKKPQPFFVEVDLAAVSPNSDFSNFQFLSDGVSIGAAFGVEFGEYQAAIGYLKVPVQLDSGGFQFSKANFGGMHLTLRRAF